MSASEQARRRLEKAAAKQRLVRIDRRPRHADRIDGFVVAVGERWALVQSTAEGGHFDALVAIRVKDVTKVRKDRTFEERFARTLPTWPPTAPPDVRLDSTRRLIKSIRHLAPLVAIEQEQRRGGVQWIGAPVGEYRGWLMLHEVRPDGSWSDEPLGYRFKRITKVEVGGRYKDALAAVMAPSPSTASRSGR